MEYRVGQRLIWSRDNTFDGPEVVSVAELRRGGKAKLSNGWVVDEDGVAQGTRNVPGGIVWEVVAGQELLDKLQRGAFVSAKH
jgi:hypothetical protein